VLDPLLYKKIKEISTFFMSIINISSCVFLFLFNAIENNLEKHQVVDARMLKEF
tara:strand:+ start:51 stop:212 length:162 start_codon:yes stop_codon:yes gene_type:complete